MLKSNARLHEEFPRVLIVEKKKKEILLGVKIENDRDDDAKARDRGDLIAGADQRGKENRMSRRTKDVAVNLFPTVFVAQIAFLNDRDE